MKWFEHKEMTNDGISTKEVNKAKQTGLMESWGERLDLKGDE